MLTKLVTSYASWRASTFASHKRAVEQVILAMRERLEESLSLEEMAEIAMLSPYHFNRVFRQITGIPPSQFLYALRLQAAKRLLLTTELSVTEVCFEVGYNSLGTFTTRFTQLVGLTPTRMRCLAAETPLSYLLSPRDYGADPFPAVPGRYGLTGRIITADALVGPILVGLFSTPIPQSRPVRCTLLTSPGPYRITSVPDGSYYIFASSLTGFENTSAYLSLDETRLHVGIGQGPIVVCNGQIGKRADVTLRPMQLIDPPILVALPFLLAERLEIGDRNRSSRFRMAEQAEIGSP